MRLTILATVLVAAAASGCANVRPYQPRDLGVSNIAERSYEIGTPYSASVGSPIVRVKDYWLHSVAIGEVEASTDFSYSSSVFPGSFDGRAGDRFRIEHEWLDGSERYLGFRSRWSDGSGFWVWANADTGRLYHRIGTPGNMVVFSFETDPPDVVFREVTRDVARAESGFVNFEVLYSGTDGNSIFATYREYTPDNMARPAFTQNLTYPVADGVIQFRDLRIRVESATAQNINYVVEADGL